jgi:hypothetical protein
VLTRHAANAAAGSALSDATPGRNRRPIPAVEDRDCRIDQNPAISVAAHIATLNETAVHRRRTARVDHTTRHRIGSSRNGERNSMLTVSATSSQSLRS